MTGLALSARIRGTRVRTRDPVLTIAAIACGIVVLVPLLGPLLTPYAPDQTDVLMASQGPSVDHLLGTDALGRDILTRIVYGARLSFAGPLIIIGVSAVLGTTLALVAAWRGGLVDVLLLRALDVMFSVPGILVAVLAAAVFGAGFWAPVIALAIVYIPYMARVVRSTAVRERNLPYVESAELAGFSGWHICTRQILPNVMPLVMAQATIGFGSALMDFGAISFLGLGVQPPQAEWGVMVSDGRAETLSGAFQQSLAAGAMIVLTVVAFNVLGERLASRMGRD